MPSIAIVGAGPGMGLAIARTFGSRGFSVALISRDGAKLDGLVDTLTAEGITAAGFAADVRDHAAIDVSLGAVAVVPGFPTAMPEEVAPVYWELHTDRDEAERVVGITK